MLYWFKASKEVKPRTAGRASRRYDASTIDSGIGTQFAVADINGDGLLDVIVSNKKGVCVITQERKPQAPEKK